MENIERPATDPKFEQWCILELLGHKKIAGKVTEEVVAGSALLRIDVPETSRRPGYTKYFSTGSLYCLTPCDEEIARRAAEGIERVTDPIPVYLPDPPRQLAAGETVRANVEEDDEECLDPDAIDHGWDNEDAGDLPP